MGVAIGFFCTFDEEHHAVTLERATLVAFGRETKHRRIHKSVHRHCEGSVLHNIGEAQA